MFKRLLRSSIPGVFVLLWSTGFIGAKFGLPYAEPYTMLLYRFVLTLSLLLVLIAYFKPSFPRSWSQRLHLMLSGSLIHGAYLGGVFSAIKLGMPAGLCALIVGLQPVLTTAGAFLFLKEKVSGLQWAGIVLGFFGLYLIFAAGSGQSTALDQRALWAAVIALLGITAGTLYQKKFCTSNSLLGSAWFQYVATVLIFWGGSCFFETGVVTLNPRFIFAVMWLAIVLSIGAILLLTYLIKHGEMHKVASLFYLVPAVTALEAAWFFDEKLGTEKIAGMAIVTAAVFLVIHSRGFRAIKA